MRHRRAFDEQPVALEPDGPHLLAADPCLVPGGLDLGDRCYLIACGLMGEPVPPVITSGGPQKKNS
jgi:hypothetical protein